MKGNIKASPVLCDENPPLTGGFPSQRASDAETVSKTWRHYVVSVHETLHVALVDWLIILYEKQQKYNLRCLVRRKILSMSWTTLIYYMQNCAHTFGIMMSWHENRFRITDPLWGESYGPHRSVLLTKGLLCNVSFNVSFLAILIKPLKIVKRVVGDLRRLNALVSSL